MSSPFFILHPPTSLSLLFPPNFIPSHPIPSHHPLLPPENPSHACPSIPPFSRVTHTLSSPHTPANGSYVAFRHLVYSLASATKSATSSPARCARNAYPTS